MPLRPSTSNTTGVEVLEPDHGIFDFKVVDNFSRNYLATYYNQPPTTDEHTVLSFLARHYPKIAGQPCAIEIGCGPTVHHVLPLAPYVSEIHMADYLPDNLEQVALWRDGAATAHCWQHYTSLTLQLEGRADTPVAIQQRERDVRAKMTSVKRCDLKSAQPLPSTAQYAAVGCFYVAENIGIARDEWARVMARIAAITAPGGHLFLSALRQTDHYVVRYPGGITRRYPSAVLTEDDFHNLLPRLGFSAQDLVVESRDIAGQEDEGVKGVILVVARKTG